MNRVVYNGVEEEIEAPSVSLRNDEVSVLDLLVALAKHRRMILRSTVGATLLAIVVAFLLPVKYEAVAKLLPPAQNQSGAAALLNQLSGLGSAANVISTGLNLKNPSDVYVAMLKSRTIKDKLIDRFDLRKLYKVKNRTDARRVLDSNTDITTGKEGVITLAFEDGDPKRAKEIAEAYVTELMALTENLAISEASQRRLYFQKQLEQEKNRLADAEVELKMTQQSTGMIMPGEQARAVVGGIAQLRALTAAKEVQIHAIRSYATAQNPQLIQAQQELAGLKAQLREMEKGQASGSEDTVISAGKLPEKSLEFLRKYREFKYHETLFEILAKQYEMARLDEAKDFAMIQVLDSPVVPDTKSRPKRSLVIAMFTLTVLMGACLVAFVREVHHVRHYSPEEAAKLAFIKQLWLRRP